MIVTFDIADGSFDFYSKKEWEAQLQAWRVELDDDGYEGSESLDAEELVEMMYRGNMFFETVTEMKMK
jgi:hypothetical protein